MPSLSKGTTAKGSADRPDPDSMEKAVFDLIRDVEGFRQAGIAIFGKHGWIRKTSKCSGVNESTIFRWIGEQSQPPAYAFALMSAWLTVFRATGQRPPEITD